MITMNTKNGISESELNILKFSIFLYEDLQ